MESSEPNRRPGPGGHDGPEIEEPSPREVAELIERLRRLEAQADREPPDPPRGPAREEEGIASP